MPKQTRVAISHFGIVINSSRVLVQKIFEHSKEISRLSIRLTIIVENLDVLLSHLRIRIPLLESIYRL
mgnify:CR=1 FL=1